LCAAELKVTSATLRTFRSGSVRVARKSPMQLRKRGSMACGTSEMVNFIAVRREKRSMKSDAFGLSTFSSTYP